MCNLFLLLEYSHIISRYIQCTHKEHVCVAMATMDGGGGGGGGGGGEGEVEKSSIEVMMMRRHSREMREVLITTPRSV